MDMCSHKWGRVALSVVLMLLLIIGMSNSHSSNKYKQQSLCHLSMPTLLIPGLTVSLVTDLYICKYVYSVPTKLCLHTFLYFIVWKLGRIGSIIYLKMSLCVQGILILICVLTEYFSK